VICKRGHQPSGLGGSLRSVRDVSLNPHQW
jgi:hypothetical protein